MLTEKNPNLQFDQFLFSHFGIKQDSCDTIEQDISPVRCACATSCDCKTRAKESAKRKQVEKATCSSPKVEKKAEPKIVLKEKNLSPFEELVSLKEIEPEYKEESVKTLSEVIESIPNRVRSMNIEELSHKHENEWYHAFRDLKEELVEEVSKKHPHHSGHIKKNSEIKNFTEQFDDSIDKVMLEVERIFQAWPNMSRVAVIYLLAIVISIPLFFASGMAQNKQAEVYRQNRLGYIEAQVFEVDQETKSTFIKENAAQILASGEGVYKVSEGTKNPGRVAGVYEEEGDNDNKIHLRVRNLYRKIADIQDEFEYFIDNLID